MRGGLLTLITVLLVARAGQGLGAEWLRAGLNSDKPLWGIKDGVHFAIYPGSVGGHGDGGPRGLIRLGYPSLPGGRYALINFIAVEPIVGGRRGFSELEHSRLDGVSGKRFWVNAASNEVKPPDALDAGKLWRPIPRVERLDVTIRVEQFDNGAHVYLVASQSSDAPDEVMFTVHTEPDSAPMDYCILTATMGNMTRARRLWLRDEVVSSLRLYPEYHDIHFASHSTFPRARLRTTPAGGVIVAITGDEANPAGVHPFPGSDDWYYGGSKVTQYWRVPAGAAPDDLEAVVNGRFTYWMSRQPVPGGIAFENFELRERFRDGQQSLFGITRRTPRDLGWPAVSE